MNDRGATWEKLRDWDWEEQSVRGAKKVKWLNE